MSSLFQIAERIERHARALGFLVTRDGSRISASQYIYCATDTETRKIRVSDHAPGAGGTDAHFDVRVGPGALPHGWALAVAWLAGIVGRPVPPPAKVALAAARRREDVARARAEAEAAAREARLNDRSWLERPASAAHRAWAALARESPDRIRDVAPFTGRHHHRVALAAEYERRYPGDVEWPSTVADELRRAGVL